MQQILGSNRQYPLQIFKRDRIDDKFLIFVILKVVPLTLFEFVQIDPLNWRFVSSPKTHSDNLLGLIAVCRILIYLLAHLSLIIHRKISCLVWLHYQSHLCCHLLGSFILQGL